MPLLSPRATPAAAPPAIPGILASAGAAGPALLRMLSRARRRGLPLALVRLEWPAAAPAPAQRRFCQGLAAALRISDLAWWARPGTELMLLLEAAETVEAVVERLARRAATAGLPARLRTARFPQHGLTLAALLENVNAASHPAAAAVEADADAGTGRTA